MTILDVFYETSWWVQKLIPFVIILADEFNFIKTFNHLFNIIAVHHCLNALWSTVFLFIFCFPTCDSSIAIIVCIIKERKGMSIK